MASDAASFFKIRRRFPTRVPRAMRFKICLQALTRTPERRIPSRLSLDLRRRTRSGETPQSQEFQRDRLTR
ncbi:hypothetical protein U1Q18_042886 [Sarracenia purpurea var. burkii]